MLAHVGLLSPTFSSNTSSPSAARRYSAATLLSFFFHRIIRSGPRLLLYLAFFLIGVVFVTEFLLADSSHSWTFRSGFRSHSHSYSNAPPPGTNNKHDGLVGGGLRVVVFGENDIATSMWRDVKPVRDSGTLATHNDTSWTKEMCLELGCTTYLSYVPRLDSARRSLANTAIYAKLSEAVLKRSKDSTPANDFSYVVDAYPVTEQAHDLRAQVSAFLREPAPERPPKETIYVFSFGMWDVWSLAAFPPRQAEDAVDAIVQDMFMAVEELYAAAYDSDSVAYSDPMAKPLELVDAGQTAASKMSAPHLSSRWTGQPAKLPWDSHPASWPFRVLVPLVIDPSVMPAWRLDRPALPKLHMESEQLRNAVRLTKRWNDRVLYEMEVWIAKGTDQHALLPKLITVKRGQSEGRPTLFRDGTVFHMPDYVMDALIDGQLQAKGITDSKGFGKFGKVLGFSHVDAPCATATTLALSPVTTPVLTVDMLPKEHREVAARGEALPAAGEVAGAQSAVNGMDQNSGVHICEKPDAYLFFTSFSLGWRAIEDVGSLAAALLRADRETRTRWEESSASRDDRAPASWKKYYAP